MTQLPPIPGVRRHFVEARGVRFHVTESGSGQPVLALHGWPQHHYAYRDLLGDPPAGLRIIAPDLPGYGWSGPAPHRWAKDDVASDVLALLDAMELDKVLLVGHDWGGWIGHLLVLRAPERFRGYLALSIPHPWVRPGTFAHQAWRMAHMPLMAAAGSPLSRHTPFVRQALRFGARGALSADDVRWFADRFRDPVGARAARDTYRTFVTRELTGPARHPERRKASVPIHVLLGTKDLIHRSLARQETAKADDYTLEMVDDCGHFLVDERPDLVRQRLLDLAART